MGREGEGLSPERKSWLRPCSIPGRFASRYLLDGSPPDDKKWLT